MLDERITEWLRGLLARHGAVAGTVHVVRGDHLAIVAAVNIPPKVQEVTATIPLGKGMAGLAWQHDRPIQTCNLQDDTSGEVRPGAKAVDARAALDLELGPVVHHDLQDPRNVVLEMRRLAALGIDQGLDRCRPFPPRLKDRAPDGRTADLDEFQPPLGELAHFIRLGERLDFSLLHYR